MAAKSAKNLEALITEMEKLTDKCEVFQKENESLKKQVLKLKKDNEKLSKAAVDTKKDPADNAKPDVKSDVKPAADSDAIYKLSLELETYRRIIEAKDAQLDRYREEESNRRIENTVNTSNVGTYEQLYNKKIAECNRLSQENEINAAKMAALKNANDAYKKEIAGLLKQIALKEKENNALLSSNIDTTKEVIMSMMSTPADKGSVPVKKKTGRKKTASTYQAWKEAYESGITDEREMERRGICSMRTHFRNVQKYKKEQAAKKK